MFRACGLRGREYRGSFLLLSDYNFPPIMQTISSKTFCIIQIKVNKIVKQNNTIKL